MVDVQQRYAEAQAAILEAIDVAAEYRSWGVAFSTDRVTGKGWLPCHAAGRKDANASAAVGIVGGVRGRYRDLGNGDNFNFWEAGVRFGNYADWKAVRRSYAEKTGIALPGEDEPKRASDSVSFADGRIDATVIDGWCRVKTGFTIEDCLDNGCRYGHYPRLPAGSKRQAQSVVCFPAYNPPGLLDADVSAWVVAEVSGGDIVLHKGGGREPVRHKMISVGGSVGGLLGEYALRLLGGDTARHAVGDAGTPDDPVVWKVEGLSDLLTLHAAFRRAGLLGRHVVISNSQGAVETPKAEWIRLLAGRRVRVVQDCDRPGQIGAANWCRLLAGVAADVRNVVLPYEILDKHGKDVRDFLHKDGNDVDCMLRLAEEATPYVRSADATPVASFMPQYAAQRQLDWDAKGRTPRADGTPDAGDEPGAGLGSPGEPPGSRLPVAGGIRLAQPKDAHEAHAKAILDLLGLDVLGYYADTGLAMDVYSRFKRCVFPLSNIDTLSYAKLIGWCGSVVKDHVHEGRDKVPDMFTMSDVRNSLTMWAKTNLALYGTRGDGIWPADSAAGYVVVNGGDAWLYDRNRHTLGRLTDPRIDDKTVIDFSGGEPWADIDELARYVLASADPAWCREVLESVERVFSSWNWKHPQDSWTTTMLVAATFIQTLWHWRPEVAVTGPSDCGKALALDTPIPTPAGWKTMGDIVVGDTVYDETDATATVLAVTDVQHGRDCYRVAFDDGTSVVASAEHLWTARNESTGEARTLTTGLMARYFACRHGVAYTIASHAKTHRIVRIDHAVGVPVKCIQVDSPSKLYLCGPGRVPTHNSTLLSVLQGIFGKLKLHTSKPSEAGLRQAIGNRSCAIMIDEFENDGKRQAILELLRTTSQGGEVLRGSSDQKGRSFGLRHIPWMAAIETGLSKAADRNRFIVLDLDKLSDAARGNIELPTPDALRSMGLKICAVSLRHAETAKKLFYKLRSSKFDGVHGRVVESYSTPASLKAAVYGLDGDLAVGVLGGFLADRSSLARQGGGDESDVMRAILDSTFLPGGGASMVSVASVLCDQAQYMAHGPVLETLGVALTDGKTGPRRRDMRGKTFIFIDVDKVKRQLLRGTAWERLDCEQLLLRLPGAQRRQRMINGGRVYGPEVPVRDWVEFRPAEDTLDALLPEMPDTPVVLGDTPVPFADVGSVAPAAAPAAVRPAVHAPVSAPADAADTPADTPADAARAAEESRQQRLRKLQEALGDYGA